MTIYMPLENEGTDVWRPVLGEELSTGIFKIVSAKEHDEEDWRFAPGSVVRVEERASFGEKHLVAVEAVS